MMLLQNFDGCQQQAICDSSVDLSNKAQLQFIKFLHLSAHAETD